MSDKIINALFGGQRESLTYAGFGECPKCGDDSAEFWRDDGTGKLYTRCPYFMCDNWGKLTEVENKFPNHCWYCGAKVIGEGESDEA